MPLCECGCGKEVNWYRGKPNRFIIGHHWRVQPFSSEHRRHMAEARKGLKQSEETRRKKSGKNHHYWGKHRSEETKHKISEALSGRPLAPETVHKMSASLRGLTRSKETRQRIAEAKMGELNPAWRGGTSQDGHGPAFNDALKRRVRERDGFTCQICGYRENGKVHHCHHIDYDKRNNNADNLIALCGSCHGLTTINRPYWQTVFEMRRGVRLLPNLKVVALAGV